MLRRRKRSGARTAASMLGALAAAAAASCVVTSAPISTPMAAGSQQVFQCAVPANFKHDISVHNAAGASLDVIATFGEYCSVSFINGPGIQAFNDYSTFSASTATTISFTGAPCATAPCCYIVACADIRTGSCGGPITVTSQFYDPAAAPTPAPGPDNSPPSGGADAGAVAGSVVGCLAVAGAGAALRARRRSAAYASLPAAAGASLYALPSVGARASTQVNTVSQAGGYQGAPFASL